MQAAGGGAGEGRLEAAAHLEGALESVLLQSGLHTRGH